MFFKVADVSDFSEEEINSAFAKLPASQKSYISKKRGLKYKQSVIARILINDLLTQHFDVNDGYSLLIDEKNRTHYYNDELCLSISHSDIYVACAVSENKVGIDIQTYKKVTDKLINKVCTKEEVGFINSTDEKNFFVIWTAKEAFAKYSGKFLYDVFKISFINANDISLTGKDSPKILNFSNENFALTIIE